MNLSEKYDVVIANKSLMYDLMGKETKVRIDDYVTKTFAMRGNQAAMFTDRDTLTGLFGGQPLSLHPTLGKFGAYVPEASYPYQYEYLIQRMNKDEKGSDNFYFILIQARPSL